MALGYMLVGIVVGTLAAALSLVAGAGFGMAALAYAGGGMLGLGLGVLAALFPPAPRLQPETAS